MIHPGLSPLIFATTKTLSKWTFRARAWTAANDKARELGWIV